MMHAYALIKISIVLRDSFEVFFFGQIILLSKIINLSSIKFSKFYCMLKFLSKLKQSATFCKNKGRR